MKLNEPAGQHHVGLTNTEHTRWITVLRLSSYTVWDRAEGLSDISRSRASECLFASALALRKPLTRLLPCPNSPASGSGGKCIVNLRSAIRTILIVWNRAQKRVVPLIFLAATSLVMMSIQAADKLNILFIAVDDMRPELGCYGNKIVKTPNIDRLAARGTVFTKAYCQQAVCSPSRTSIMTGLRPDATKVWDLETHFRVAQPDCVTMPQFFKANGYHTVALSKIYHSGFEDGRSWNEPHWYPKGRAVDTDQVDWTKQIVTRHDIDVEEFSNPLADGPERKNGKSAKKGPAFEVSPKEDDQLPDGATAAQAVKRLSSLKSKEKPFFLAVGFLKPHLPFVAPKKYWDLYDPNTIPVPTTDRLPEGSPEFAGHNNSELHNYPGVPRRIRFRLILRRRFGMATMHASATPMLRLAAYSMHSIKKDSLITPLSFSGAIMDGSWVITDFGTSTRISKWPRVFRS